MTNRSSTLPANLSPSVPVSGQKIGESGRKTAKAAKPLSQPLAAHKLAATPLALRNADTDAPMASGRRAPNRPKLRSAVEVHDELSAGPLAGLRVGLLHGRMSADDKDVAMARSTTVIEVGVDVANATVMVIEHAERFGLAQLHQLRGRVGRGKARSFCVLLTGERITPDAEARLDMMVQSQNGFELAEFDLVQRGPGEFFGTRQAGLPDLRIADLSRDRKLLEVAKIEAAQFVQAPDPRSTDEERQAVWSRLKLQWQRRYGLVEA